MARKEIEVDRIIEELMKFKRTHGNKIAFVDLKTIIKELEEDIYIK